jgi:hypothetical protein
MTVSTIARPLCVLGLAVASGLLAPHSSVAATSTADVAFDFDAVSEGARVTTVGNSGTASLTTAVVTAGSGQLTGARSRSTQGGAIRFPAFSSSDSAARAVLRVDNAGNTDQMSPGTRDFTWGADVRIDSATYSTRTGTTDNGDNLVQRGLAGSGRQFKLELDAHRPACRVEGGGGALRVVLPVVLDSTSWYRASCARAGGKLTVSLARYGDTGAVTATWSKSATRSAGFGNLTWQRASIPMSVGGKLTTSGAIVSGASDQLNGTVDNVFLDISG